MHEFHRGSSSVRDLSKKEKEKDRVLKKSCAFKRIIIKIKKSQLIYRPRVWLKPDSQTKGLEGLPKAVGRGFSSFDSPNL